MPDANFKAENQGMLLVSLPVTGPRRILWASDKDPTGKGSIDWRYAIDSRGRDDPVGYIQTRPMGCTKERRFSVLPVVKVIQRPGELVLKCSRI
jgi:hypothetical protein